MGVNIWRAYVNILQKHPLKTQMITTGILAGTGDVLAQTLVEKRSIFKQNYVYMRTIRFFCLGSFYVAPALRFWYGILERYVNIVRYPAITPLVRVLLDQALYAPVFMSSFLILLRCTEGNTINEAIEKWRHDFWDIYKTGLKVWPPSQLINFYFVPLQHRIFFVQCVALFWNTYLAWRTNVVLAPDSIAVLPS